MWATLIVILCSICVISRSEIYSSFAHLKLAIETAKVADEVDLMKQYILELSDRIEKYREIEKQYAKIIELIHSTKFRCDDPVSAFKFTRGAYYLRTDLEQLQNDTKPVFDRQIFVRRTEKPFVPSVHDFSGSISGLLRLQDMYRINTIDIANGNVAGFRTKPLTLMECLDIALNAQYMYENLVARNTEAFRAGKAVEWLDTAERRVSNAKEAEYFIQASDTIYSSFQCRCTANNMDRRVYFERKYPSLNVSYLPSCTSYRKYRCQTLPSTTEKGELDGNFDALCRGETVPPIENIENRPTPKDKLICKYVHKTSPFLLLKPVKYEELNNVHPYIAILHDVIDTEEINKLKNVARPYLKRGTTRKIQGQIVSEIKVSTQFFIPLNVCETIVPKLRQRLAEVTGTHLRSFEKIQVVNYGTGGFYNIHLDLYTAKVLDTYTETTNNRLVTMVLYLGDVIAGGETAFPALGIAVKPKKGNALLFYNIKRNGGLIDDSVHSSCPVLYGEKWIANQWVGRNGQEFSYPCAVDKNL